MTYRIKIDRKGRVVIPKKVREEMGIGADDVLLMFVKGDSIILKKEKDPFKTLEEILGDITFKRDIRRRAYEEAVREAEGD